MPESNRTNRLKTFWLPHQTRKQFPHPPDFSPVLPSPDIPLHSRQNPYSRSGELMPAKLVHMDKDRPRKLTPTVNRNAPPLSPLFDSEDDTAAGATGEPLIQDFATSSIPKEYIPFTARDSDTNSLDLPMQRPPAMIISDDDDEFTPRINYSNRRQEPQYRPRSSRFVFLSAFALC